MCLNVLTFYLPSGDMYLALPAQRGPTKSLLWPKEQYHGPDPFMTPTCPDQTQQRIASYIGKKDFWEVSPIFQLKTSVLSRCAWWSRNLGKNTCFSLKNKYFILETGTVSFCAWLWVMHDSSTLENQSGLHQGTKMCITAEHFPAIFPFYQAQPQKLVQLRRRMIEQLWWVSGIQSGSTHCKVLQWCCRYNLHSAKVWNKHHCKAMRVFSKKAKKLKYRGAWRYPQIKVNLDQVLF